MARLKNFVKGMPGALATYEAAAAPFKAAFNFRQENQDLADFAESRGNERLGLVAEGKSRGIGDYDDAGYGALLKESMFGYDPDKEVGDYNMFQYPGLVGLGKGAMRGLGTMGQGVEALYHTLGGAMAYGLTGDKSALVDPSDPNNWRITEQGAEFEPKGFRESAEVQTARQQAEALEGLRESLTPEDIEELKTMATIPGTPEEGERARRMLTELAGVSPEDLPTEAETMADLPEEYRQFEMPELDATETGVYDEGADDITTEAGAPALAAGEYRIASIDPRTGRPLRVGAGVGSQGTGPMSRERGQQLIAGGGRQGAANRVILKDMRKWQANDKKRVGALQNKVDVRMADGTVVPGERIAQMSPLQRTRFFDETKGASLIGKDPNLDRSAYTSVAGETDPVKRAMALGQAQENIAQNMRRRAQGRVGGVGGGQAGPTPQERLILNRAINSRDTRTMREAERIRQKYERPQDDRQAMAERMMADRNANREANRRNKLEIARVEAAGRRGGGLTTQGLTPEQASQKAYTDQLLDAIGLLPEDAEGRETAANLLVNQLQQMMQAQGQPQAPQGGVGGQIPPEMAQRPGLRQDMLWRNPNAQSQLLRLLGEQARYAPDLSGGTIGNILRQNL
jgi:hypothetical protein